jgi:hypothetical protein
VTQLRLLLPPETADGVVLGEDRPTNQNHTSFNNDERTRNQNNRASPSPKRLGAGVPVLRNLSGLRVSKLKEKEELAVMGTNPVKEDTYTLHNKSPIPKGEILKGKAPLGPMLP